MRKKLFFIFILIATVFIMPEKAYAYSAYDYEYKPLCGNYEIASFKSDGTVTAVACHDDFYVARNDMRARGGEDLAIIANYIGKVKILDANAAIVDFTMNGNNLTNFYNNFDLSGYSYTYIFGGSGYGGVDGAFIDSAWSPNAGWTVKTKIANYTGWAHIETLEIVPITWVRSISSYTVTNESIAHNYVYKIQDYNYSPQSREIGPKPEMLSPGMYYSYDGHYFYNNISLMLKDYKAGIYDNSVNKANPYYNYYMYLSNHTKTTYSSINIDEYIRNNLGLTRDAYGNAASNNASRLYGKGTYFYNAQQKYGVNAIMSLSLSRNETGNGTSNLAINKNNGFGLNAVDSNPYQAADWYASFASSILGYASKWVTYGYAHPRDWRYYGPQFGDKLLGMNVKYASDAYWSEKMASFYYAFDRAKGLQDYNYYQLGIANSSFYTYSAPSTSAKAVYKYTEYGDSIVIVGYKDGWYEIVSDLNIDSNYNEITSGDYNWNQTVWAHSSNVTLINNGKNGYISPNSVTDYLDSDYTYDLMVVNTEYYPKVGYSLKTTDFYYDSALQSIKNQKLVKNRYVMIHGIAYDSTGKVVSYLVTSDYWYDQKHWVSADSITISNKAYGKSSVTAPGNQYTWVNYNQQELESTTISGLFTNTYVPILEEAWVDGRKWYKVPVDISGTTYEYGWTLADIENVYIQLYGTITTDNFPVINASDRTIIQGTDINLLDGVTAADIEDGIITNNVKVRSSDFNKDVVGTYTIVYEVTDITNLTATKTITITVIKNELPVITAEDIVIKENGTLTENVSATDKEDGDLTSSIVKKDSTVDVTTPGEYTITYYVKDSYNQEVTKTIKVTVLEDKAPVINATDKEIEINFTFDELRGVTATDEEDGDLTESIEVTENTVKTDTLGTYKVTYQVIDSNKTKTTKTITVKVVEKVDRELTKQNGEFYLEELSFDKTTKKYTISGYQIILNQNNSTDSKYELVLKNKNSEDKYYINIGSWTKDTPFDIGTIDGFNYTNSWFKGTLDFSSIPNGDYELYLKATKGDYYSENIVDNAFNNPIDRRGEDSKHGYTFRVNLNLRSQKMDLNIRDNVYTSSTAPTFRNMINDYENISFSNNKLHLIGTSYNYGGTYDNSLLITRKLLIEDTTTYKQYEYDLGTTNNFPYDVICTDGKSKKYSWYDAEVDISNLPKGTYSVQVYTKTTDAIDYGEVVDDFQVHEEISKTIGSNSYKVTRNNNRNNRIEIIVE